MGRWAPEASLLQLNATSWEVSVFHVPTHLLRLLPEEGAKAAERVFSRVSRSWPSSSTTWGRAFPLPSGLAKLDVPVTFSIWPGSSHMERVARLAHAADQDILVHQPMEPMNYPKVNPGPGAVLTSMEPGAHSPGGGGEPGPGTLCTGVQQPHGLPFHPERLRRGGGSWRVVGNERCSSWTA